MNYEQIKPEERYVIQTNDGFVSHTFWTATTIPSFTEGDSLQDAHIYTGKYLLSIPHRKEVRSRFELITERFPHVKFKEVSIKLKN